MMGESESKFDVPVESISDAPGFTMRFSGDTVRAELAGAKLYAEAEGDDRTRMRLTDSSGEVLADITLHPRSHRNATENVIDVASALLWSHWRYTQSQAKASVTAAFVDTPNEADAMTAPSALVHGLDENWRCAACDSSAGDRSKSSDSDVLTQKQAGLVNGPAAAPLAPFTPGSTWTGPDGTVYDVVRPEEVGDRPRWWIWSAEQLAPEELADLHTDDLHVWGASPAPIFALVFHTAPDLRTSLRSLLGLPAGADDEAVRGAVETLKRDRDGRDALIRGCVDIEAAKYMTLIEQLRLELGETRSKLAAAEAKAERLRVDLDAERVALETAREGRASDREALGELADKLAAADRAGEASRLARDEALAAARRYEQEGTDLAVRITAIVREHVIGTIEPEPALEGLLRIERALVEWQAMWNREHAENVRLRKRLAKLTAKPARKAKPRAKATGPLVNGSRWVHRRTGRVAVVALINARRGWVSYRYEQRAPFEKTLTATVTRRRFREEFEFAKVQRKGGW